MRELVDQALDHTLDMCKGPEELAFLNALDTKVRKDGADDWMAAIAIWRVNTSWRFVRKGGGLSVLSPSPLARANEPRVTTGRSLRYTPA